MRLSGSLLLVALAWAKPANAHKGPNYGLLALGGDMNDVTSDYHREDCNDDFLVKATVSPSEVKDGETASVSWAASDVSVTVTTSSWIGYYCSDDLDSLPDTNYVDYRYLSDDEVSAIGGDFQTKIKSARSSACEFRFFSSSYCRIGLSPAITVSDAKTKVSHLHLALTANQREMRVSWTTSTKSQPEVHLDESSDLSGATTFVGTCRTYEQR